MNSRQLLPGLWLLLAGILLACGGGDGGSDEDVDVLEDVETGLLCGSSPCADGEGCCDYQCVELTENPDNCGACGNVCDPTETCSDGVCRCGEPACGPTDACCDLGAGELQCIDVNADKDNCGACGNSCGGSERCLNGTCACLAGDGSYEQCGGDETCCPGIGCRNVETDPTNCGACGNLCGAGELCDGGQCACGEVKGEGINSACGDNESCCGSPAECLPDDDEACICGAATCVAGQICCKVDQGGMLMETCVRPDADPENCGGCGNACGTATICRGATCRCAGAFADCDMDPANGCETSTRSDVDNCGACGQVCVAGQICDGTGDCALSCQIGLTNCEGACIDLNSDTRHCGACAANCPGGEICDGVGQCADSCQVGYTECPDGCYDIYSDGNNCGACNVACGPGQVCDGHGQCDITCQPGYTPCGNGCWDLQGNRRHCGACGVSCGSGEVCNGEGQCAPTCAAGYTECGGNCVDLNTAFTHCGTCGVACEAGELCIAGQCQVSCPPGQIQCNGGCVDPDNDDENCGACGRSCGVGGACVSGVCDQQCDGGREICGGACVDVLFSDANCGSCGNACPMGERCNNGSCEPAGACDVGLTDCSGACVNTMTSVFHCGTCGNSCGPFSMCSSGVCECSAGFQDCVMGDGITCDSNTNYDPQNCGACGMACDAGERCVQGTCQCQPGLDDCDGNPANGCESNITRSLQHCGGCNNSCLGENPACIASQCVPDYLQVKFAADYSGSRGCRIDNQGAVFCAGAGSAGSLGPVLDEVIDTPTELTSLPGQAVHVAVNGPVGCAVLQSGAVWCWGDDSVDHCATCAPTGEPQKIPYFDGTTTGTTATSVAVGRTWTCFISGDGELLCQGEQVYSQMGKGQDFTDQLTPDVIPGIDGVAASARQVVGGSNWLCALVDTAMATGAVWCWGRNQNGQVGIGTTSPFVATPTQATGLDGINLSVVKLAAKATNVCALTDAGEVYCWGGNPGSLGTVDTSRPVTQPSPNTYFQTGGGVALDIAGGGQSYCALSATGGTLCWGENERDCVFAEKTTSRFSRPEPIPGANGLSRIYRTPDMVVGVDANGGLVGWGTNSSGQMAKPAIKPHLVPVPMLDPAGATFGPAASVSVGESTICVCDTSGSAYCAGENDDSLLGNGTEESVVYPYSTSLVSVLNVVDCQDIAVGARGACVRDSSGALHCWGRSGVPLPDSTFSSATPAITFDGQTVSIEKMDVGYNHGCGIDSNGALWCWGSDNSGARGDGPGSSVSPTQVVGFDGVAMSAIDVDVGEAVSCAVANTGAVYCWGDGGDGALGNNTYTDSEVPVQVQGIDGTSKSAIDVGLGPNHACAVLDTGAVECWGNSSGNKLGALVFPSTAVPVPVTGLDGISLSAEVVDGGRYHTCAIMDDSSVMCWGIAHLLGRDDITGNSSMTPVTVDLNWSNANAVQLSVHDGPDNANAGTGYSTCVVLDTSEVWCWGDDNSGAHAQNSIHRVCTPEPLGYSP